MENTTKIQHAALGLFLAVSLVLLWFIIDSARGLMQVTVTWTAASVMLTLTEALIVLAILAIALITLYTIKKEGNPFHVKSVKRLRAMAILLVIYEPYSFVREMILGEIYPISIADGTSITLITVNPTFEGIALVAGLVVYCVSLVFQYGITLQQQFDETL